MRLAAGLCPDPLGEIKGFLAAIGGRVLLLKGRGEREGMKRKGRDGNGRGLPFHYLTSDYGPVTKVSRYITRLLKEKPL